MDESITDQTTFQTTLMVQNLEGRRRSIANQLRRLADAVDAADPRPDLGRLYSHSGTDVVNTVLWGMANLGLDGFITDCAELDIMLANERTTA